MIDQATTSLMLGSGGEAILISTEEDFWTAIHSSCDFIVLLKKSGLNVVLPEGDKQCQRRFEVLVDFILTKNGLSADRPKWMTDDLVRRGAETVGARIHSMQQDLIEAPILDRMKTIVDGFKTAG